MVIFCSTHVSEPQKLLHSINLDIPLTLTAGRKDDSFYVQRVRSTTGREVLLTSQALNTEFQKSMPLANDDVCFCKIISRTSHWVQEVYCGFKTVGVTIRIHNAHFNKHKFLKHFKSHEIHPTLQIFRHSACPHRF